MVIKRQYLSDNVKNGYIAHNIFLKKIMENDPKDSKVISMPDINGEELASAVARALRSSGAKGSSQKNASGEERQRFAGLGVKGEEASHAQAEKPLRAKVEVLSSPVDDAEEAASPEPIRNLSLKASGHKESIIKQVPVSLIKESPYQTRTNFDEDELSELSLSIKQKGILQPLIVRKLEGESHPYELIAGERRLRASKLAELDVVPVIEKEMSNKEALEASIVENAQRQDLNPVEEARAFKLLSTEFKLSQTKIAEATSKSRETVANSLRLLQLTEPVLELIEEGHLSSGHGKILASLDEKEQISYSRKILVNSLSVRGLEKLVQKRESQEEDTDTTGSSVSLSEKESQKLKASLRRFETKIAELTKIEEEQVRLTVDNQGRKKVGITFDTEASFKRFMSKLRG